MASASSEGLSSNYVFNQYYWDFLKKVKDFAKKKKESSKHARTFLRTLRDHYQSFDKLSTEHITFFKEHAYATWEQYQSCSMSDAGIFFESEACEKCLIYKQITLSDISKLVKSEPVLLHQYFTLFGLLSTESMDVHVLLGLMKQFKLNDELKEKLEALPEGILRTALTRLYELFETLTKSSTSSNLLEEIEQTTLGKLAKEIMDEINLDDLQKSVSPDLLQGNLMDMFTKQDGGLAKIISTVSQKMVSKMASGELQQEDLLKDALNVATKLPGMMPGGMGNDFSKMGDMLSALSGMGGGGAGGSSSPGNFDISSLMNMMTGMNIGGQKVSKKQVNQAGRAGLAKTKLSSEMKRQRVAEKLRKQLDDKKKNLDGQLEKDHDN
jgi:hypothetical protein